jgi:hypothetical protein
MNAPAEANAAQAAHTSSRGRGRGRGGGSAPRGRTTQGRVSVPKAQNAKIGPNRLLETEWVKDSILKGNCFVLFAGSGQAGDQQWTFHHPIGETSLDERDWVATPTRDISYLLQRRESEALVAWKRQSELAKRQYILHLQRGRKMSNEDQEVWTFENAPAIQPTIRSCMAAAKAAGANESAWLDYADRAVQVAEQTFKEAMRTQAVPSGWIRENPKPVHETMGGPLGDHPQKAIPFLKGMSTATAKDKVIRVAIGLDLADESSDEDSDVEDDAEEATPVASQPSNGLQRQARTSRSHSRDKSQGSVKSNHSNGSKK